MNMLSSVILGSAERLARIIPKPGIDFGKIGMVVDKMSGLSRSGSVGTEISDLAQLLNEQRELQGEMLWINMQSNILRTEHESKMAPARNMRVA